MSPINLLTDDENINSLLLNIYNSVSKKNKNIGILDEVLDKLDLILSIDNSRKIIISLIILTIAIRDKNGDKGFKYISRKMFIYLYKKYPKLVKISLSSYIDVGYFKDLNYIIADLYEEGYNNDNELIIACYQLYAKQFNNDLRSFKENKEVSFCVKYIPKPSSMWQKKYGMTTELIKYIYPDISNKINAKNKYRREYVKLNKYKLTTETLMSSNSWNDINFENVPVKCQVRNIMAFSSKCSDRFNNYMKDKIYQNNENLNFIQLVDKIINYNFDEELCLKLEKELPKYIDNFNINLENHIISLDIDELNNIDDT